MNAGSATLAVLVALIVGFGGGWLFRKDTATTTTTTTTTTSSSTTTSSTIPLAAACSGAALAGSVSASQGAAGSVQVTFVVTNAGAKACTVDGYPSVQLLSANQTAMTTMRVLGGAVFQPAAANAAPKRQRVGA